jgi:hypothetical protein
MLTLVEGPDGCGKTTLCQTPAFQDLHYVKWGPPDFPQENMFFKFFEGLQKTPENAVLDRLYPSEMIYGPLFQRPTWFDRARQRMMDRYLLSRSTVLLICLARYEIAEENWARRNLAGGEYVVDQDWYRQVYDGYRHFQTDLPKLYWDYTVGSKAVKVRERIEVRRPPPNEGPGIGAFRRGVTLMVGERINDNLKGPKLPFVQFEQGGSWWLTNELERVGYPERSLYWINARDYLTDAECHPGFMDLLDPAHVVALGKVAAEWCEKVARVPYAALEHPAYWRRFRTGEEYPLAQALQGPTKAPFMQE